MPPRYQQGQLASPVVGTPGVDTSAGAVEQQIAQQTAQFSGQLAQTSAEMSKEQSALESQKTALTTQKLAQAEQDFNHARGQFFYYGAQQEAARRHQQYLDKLQADEQRKLQAQFDRVEEDDRMGSTVANLKDQYTNSPMQAVKSFQDQIPVMRQEFQDRHSDDEIRLRMLMPSQRQAEHSALSDLQTWARTTINQNLEKKLMLLPDQLSEKIGDLSGHLDQQIVGYHKSLAQVNGIYESMKASAVTTAARDQIEAKRIVLNQDAAKQVIDHWMAQTPEGEQGVTYIDGVKSVVANAKQFGLFLKPSDQESLLERLHSQRGIHEGEVITGIKSDSDLRLLDANKLKANLYQAANDPKEMAAIASQVQGRFKDLDAQISQIGKEPDSKIKTAKLTGLKQEQNALIAEMGQDLKLERGFDQLQRTLTSFAQSQIKFGQSQTRWEQWIRDQQEKQDTKSANAVKTQNTEAFNNDWAKIQTSLQSAWSQPAGSKQQEAISKIVADAIPRLNAAVNDGTVKADHFGEYMNQLKGQTESASLKQTSSGWFGFGQQTKTLKGNERQKAVDNAKAQFAGLVQQEQANFLATQSSIKQVEALAQSKGEKALLTQYVSANLPRVFQADAYRRMSPDKQAAFRANFVRQAVVRFRQGTLQ